MNEIRDKQIETQRYDAAASRALSTTSQAHALGSAGIREELRAPYLAFEELVRETLTSEMRALELGAGGGMHTQALVDTGAAVTASDLSETSLQLLRRAVHAPLGNLRTALADIESLPFGDGEFDVVSSAGALSYGDPFKVRNEILRVLKPGGRFICVDSLNDNPIYRLNRWLQYLRGARSESTLKRMPSVKWIEDCRHCFVAVDVRFFGAATFLVPLIAGIAGTAYAARWSDRVDNAIRVRRSAFKFVMTGAKPA
jgi:SAM-dependent methyltransferase